MPETNSQAERARTLALARRAGYEDSKSGTSANLDAHAYLNDEGYRSSYQRGVEEWEQVQRNSQQKRAQRLGLDKKPKDKKRPRRAQS